MTDWIFKEIHTDNGGYFEPVKELIRCKDCYAWREGECNLEEHGWCECHKMLTHMNDFCAWAERKEE